MIEWCTDFIANGFWRAILFMFVFCTIGGILGFIFRKIPVIHNIFYYGSTTAAFFIIWHIRHGVGWLIFGILGILGFVVSTVAVFAKKKHKITDENIASVAEAANANFPTIIEDILRCEGIKTMPGKVWIYRVTILKTTDVSEIVDHLNSAGRQDILNTIKTSADFKTLRDSDVTICYEYSDEAGNILLTLQFTPGDYKK